MLGFLLVQQTTSVSIAKIASTLLFNKGKELKEINNLCDAIIHGRSGCAKPVPAGPGVFQEIREAKKYQQAMMGPDSTVGKMIRDAVQEKINAGKKSGKIVYTGNFKPTICFKCQTLGNFCGKMQYEASFQFDEAKNVYHIAAKASYSGVDPWDFAPKPGASGADNFFTELLPSKLVNMIGNYKEFDIHYNIVENINFDI